MIMQIGIIDKETIGVKKRGVGLRSEKKKQKYRAVDGIHFTTRVKHDDFGMQWLFFFIQSLLFKFALIHLLNIQ